MGFILCISDKACSITLFVLLVLKISGINDAILLGACVVTVVIPAAANTAVFAERYNGDAALHQEQLLSQPYYQWLHPGNFIFSLGKT